MHSSGIRKEKDIKALQNKEQVSLALPIFLTLGRYKFIWKVLRSSKLFADLTAESFTHQLVEEAAKNNTLDLGFTSVSNHL